MKIKDAFTQKAGVWREVGRPKARERPFAAAQVATIARIQRGPYQVLHLGIHMGGRDPNSWSIFHCFASLNQKWSSQNKNWHL